MNTVKNVEKAGRQFWLAGLGVCLLGKDFAAKKLDDVFEGTNTLVNDILSKGVDIEDQIKTKLKKDLAHDEKIAEIRQKLGLDKEHKEDKVARLVAKVDALTEVVAKLQAKSEQDAKVAETVAKAEKPAEVKAEDMVAKPVAKRATTRKPRATAAKSTTKPATRRTARKTTTSESKTDTE